MSNVDFNTTEGLYNGNHLPAFDATLDPAGAIKLHGVSKKGNTIDYYPAFSYTNVGGVLTITIQDPEKAAPNYEYFTCVVSDHKGRVLDGGSAKAGDPFTIDVSQCAQEGTWRLGFKTGKEDKNQKLSRFDFNVSIPFDSASGAFDCGDGLARSSFALDIAPNNPIKDGSIIELSTTVGNNLVGDFDINNEGLVNTQVWTVNAKDGSGVITNGTANPLTIAPSSSETATLTFDASIAGEYFGFIEARTGGVLIASFMVKWVVA